MPTAAARSVAAGDDDRAADGLEKGQESRQAIEEKDHSINRSKTVVFGCNMGTSPIVCEVHNPGYICYIVEAQLFTMLHFALQSVTHVALSLTFSWLKAPLQKWWAEHWHSCFL